MTAKAWLACTATQLEDRLELMAATPTERDIVREVCRRARLADDAGLKGSDDSRAKVPPVTWKPGRISN